MTKDTTGQAVEIKFREIKKPIRFWRVDKWLNEQGLKGWELYDSVTSYKGKYRVYKFRKPRIE